MYRNTSNILNELREYSSWNTGKLAEDRITLFDYSTFIATPDILFAMAGLFDLNFTDSKAAILSKKNSVKTFIYLGN